MEGHCQCGAITFHTPLPKPLKIYICHCLDCRHQSSSAFGVSAIFPAFKIEPPSPGAIGVYTTTTDSGKEKRCLFCSKCGSRLVHGINEEETVSVKGGCLDGLGKLEMEGAEHIWVRSAIMGISEGVKRWEMEPDEG